MDARRQERVWGLVASGARDRGVAVSAGLVCEICAETAGVDGVGLTVRSRPGRLEPLYATDSISRQLDELQFTVGEGPCVEAFRAGQPVLVPDLAADSVLSRWPGLAAAAARADAGAVFALPLQSGAIRIGVLGLYRRAAGGLGEGALADALLLADIALLVLLDRGTPPPGIGRPPGEGLAGDRAEVHQATGMISVQAAITLDQALLRLRAHAFAGERPVADVARDVVTRRLRFDPDGD